MTALSHEGCSPEAINVACAERLGFKYWTDGEETLLLPPDRNWPASTYFKDHGMREGDGRPDAPIVDATTVPNFHGSLDAAMQLVEKARDMGWLWMSDNLVKQGDVFTVFFKNKSSAHHASAPKPAAAICEAFLKLPPCP